MTIWNLFIEYFIDFWFCVGVFVCFMITAAVINEIGEKITFLVKRKNGSGTSLKLESKSETEATQKYSYLSDPDYYGE